MLTIDRVFRLIHLSNPKDFSVLARSNVFLLPLQVSEAPEDGTSAPRVTPTPSVRSQPRRLLSRASALTSAASLPFWTPPTSFSTPRSDVGENEATRSRRSRRTRRRISTSQVLDDLERFSRRTLSTGSTYSSAVGQEVSEVLLGGGAEDEDGTEVFDEEDIPDDDEGGPASTTTVNNSTGEQGRDDNNRAENEHAIS